ncbi:ferredoxin [Streptomyces sp. NPDC057877]|uniref:ferredoxin n=1 Tax=Streptomyces sp. NPDC057877 TaxID=3346269 RepID=UPI0036D206C9
MSGNRWRLAVDRTRCVGSGACVGLSPHFRLAADGRAEPCAEVFTADETARDAALCCPVEAITVTDAGTGAVIAPD